MALLLLTVCAFLLATLLAGVHLAGIGGLNPALRSLDGPTYVAVKTAADREFPRLARPLMLLTLAVAAAVTVVAGVTGRPAVAVAAGAATAGSVVTLLAILRGDLPLNRRMAAWPTAGLPADWLSVRSRWERFFAVRTVATLVAAFALGVATLLIH